MGERRPFHASDCVDLGEEADGDGVDDDGELHDGGEV